MEIHIAANFMIDRAGAPAGAGRAGRGVGA